MTRLMIFLIAFSVGLWSVTLTRDQLLSLIGNVLLYSLAAIGVVSLAGLYLVTRNIRNR